MENLVIQGKPDEHVAELDTIEIIINIIIEQAVRLSENKQRWRQAPRRAIQFL